MKLRLKSFFVIALLGGMALPAMAGDDVSTMNPKDLQAIKAIMENQSVSTVQPPSKGIVLSGYVSTSYTKQIDGSCKNGSSVVAVPNGSLTTGKLTVTIPPSDKTGLFGGFQIDAIHCSGTK